MQINTHSVSYFLNAFKNKHNFSDKRIGELLMGLSGETIRALRHGKYKSVKQYTALRLMIIVPEQLLTPMTPVRPDIISKIQLTEQQNTLKHTLFTVNKPSLWKRLLHLFRI